MDEFRTTFEEMDRRPSHFLIYGLIRKKWLGIGWVMIPKRGEECKKAGKG
jgi:hypothetical protein